MGREEGLKARPFSVLSLFPPPLPPFRCQIGRKRGPRNGTAREIRSLYQRMEGRGGEPTVIIRKSAARSESRGRATQPQMYSIFFPWPFFPSSHNRHVRYNTRPFSPSVLAWRIIPRSRLPFWLLLVSPSWSRQSSIGGHLQRWDGKGRGKPHLAQISADHENQPPCLVNALSPPRRSHMLSVCLSSKTAVVW